MTWNRKIGDLIGDFTKKLVTRMDGAPYKLLHFVHTTYRSMHKNTSKGVEHVMQIINPLWENSNVIRWHTIKHHMNTWNNQKKIEKH